MFVNDIWGFKRQIALISNRGLLWTTHSKDTSSTEHNWAIKFKTFDALSTLCVIYNRIVLVCTAASIFMHYFSTQINFCRYERCEETGKRVLLFGFFLINFLTLQKPLNTLYCVCLVKGFHVLSIGCRCGCESIFYHVCQCLALNKSNNFQLRLCLFSSLWTHLNRKSRWIWIDFSEVRLHVCVFTIR